jgi:hypothetical protein
MARTIESGIGDMVAHTPHDSNDILTTNSTAQVTKAIYLGVGGDVAVVTEKGQTVTLVSMVGGVWHPMRVTKVLATATTATSVVAGF